MIKEQLTELLNTLYEAEGLVEMALRRDEDTPGRITRLAIEKCLMAGHLAQEFSLPEDEVDKTESEAVANPVYNKLERVSEEENVTEKESEENNQPQGDAEAKQQNDLSEDEQGKAEDYVSEEKEVEVFTREVMPAIEEDRGKSRDIYDASIFTDSDDTDDDENIEMDSSLLDEDIADGQPDVQDDEAEVSEGERNQRIMENKMSGRKENAEVHEKIIARDNQAEGNDEPHRKFPERKPFIRSLSINDKFRFKRELFDNDEQLFRDSLRRFEQAADFNEARNYCEKLPAMMDRNRKEVKEFMKILEKYYRK